MPRTQQMKEYLSDFEKQLKEERLKRIKMIYEDDWKKAAEILKTALGAFMLKEDTGVFVLSYLRTSCITGSHSVVIRAKDQLTLSSEKGSFTAAGTEAVSLQQKTTGIRLEEGISFIGGELKVQ